MARQNDLRTREEATRDYRISCEIQDAVTLQLEELRAKMLRVQQNKVDAWERLAVLDHEYVGPGTEEQS